MEEEASQSIEVKPINSGCSTSTKTTVVNPPNTPSGQNNQAINQLEQQQMKDTQYDTIDQAPEIKPLTGGRRKKNNSQKLFKMEMENKMYTIYGSNALNALELFFDKKNYNKDMFIKLWNKPNNKQSNANNKQSNANNKQSENNKKPSSKLYLIRGKHSKNRIIPK